MSTRLRDRNQGRAYHGCALVKKDNLTGVVVAGGWDGDNLRSSELYQLHTGVWQDAGLLNTARQGVKMVVLEDNVLAMGGVDDNYSSLNTVEQLDMSTLSWSYG